MLHAKFQDPQISSSGEEVFKKFLPCTGVAAILVMLPGPCIQTFVPLSNGLMKFGFDMPSGFGEDLNKRVDRRTEAGYAISSSCERDITVIYVYIAPV